MTGTRTRLTAGAAAVLLAGLLAVRGFALPAEPAIEDENPYMDDVSAHVAKTFQIARRRSFDGFCAMYVHWQLMAAGIETTYRSGDAFREFEKYRNQRVTDGGYLIDALPAERYSLAGALEDLTAGTGTVRNVLVCFRTGTGPLARFGHVLLIRSVADGILYYSESSDWTVGGRRKKAGSVLTATVSEFVGYYAHFRFAGAVRFYLANEMPSSAGSPAENGYTLTDYLRTKRYLYGCRNPDESESFPVDSDGNGRITLADCRTIAGMFGF